MGPMDELGFDVLYDEGPCLVVAKPAGVLTQAPPSIDSLELRIKSWLQRRRESEESIYLGVPHRLDRPASGAMVFGTTRRATRRLAEQFEARTVEKVYWACLQGQIGGVSGVWVDRIRKVPDEPRAEIVSDEHPEGRSAALRWRRLHSGPWGTLLEIELETGRMHQVRVQAAHRGYPLLGDAMYGSTLPFGPQHADWRLRAIALHARRLAFEHPTTRQRLSLTAPLPSPWMELGLPIPDPRSLNPEP